jgi:hypothetical protein
MLAVTLLFSEFGRESLHILIIPKKLQKNKGHFEQNEAGTALFFIDIFANSRKMNSGDCKR